MKTMHILGTVVGAVMIFSVSAYAGHGEHDRGGRYDAPRHVKMGYPSHRNNWVVPLVVGGVLGYALTESRRQSVPYATIGASVVYPEQPVYEERWVYFGECDCQRRVLVRVR
ncbi:MAG: hypothetical protein M0P91_12210 [Sulfuricurvum sp.]|jgi:hypothetical protein|uniref:hypothetical protein n=1 Tax=Sulfuricurvum sp. TaxID=2025608 RepID=UPI0025FDACB8|nr:hypothetical protein [Sulfuricurvum sp.]MCK9373949.1 hypothetical protein [Sulfuricurvum sp.]